MINEARLEWRTSARSGSGEQCVELARSPRGVAIRDSKDRQGPRLSLAPAAWESFVSAVKDGAHDTL